jgi:hypothetical protein
MRLVASKKALIAVMKLAVSKLEATTADDAATS